MCVYLDRDYRSILSWDTCGPVIEKLFWLYDRKVTEKSNTKRWREDKPGL